eukprot:CAMPEP_0117650138 /NCGR_PEP_ID=MMETSP0804-20121206/1378_1 /TAXON_ID=1074897 /ORGANISM="Tetraselmis astigmatica, Strain CCMP880" /LENGTH=64 /DNA_ID=CAMNT_0005455987 /DNA_START=677 /DNA_END=868 /DNA_ORIENTATION=+
MRQYEALEIDDVNALAPVASGPALHLAVHRLDTIVGPLLTPLGALPIPSPCTGEDLLPHHGSLW